MRLPTRLPAVSASVDDGPTARPGGSTAALFSALGIRITAPPLIVLGGGAFVIALFAGRVVGHVVGVIVFFVVLGLPFGHHPIAAERLRRNASESLPAVCASVARSLRTGHQLDHALAHATENTTTTESLVAASRALRSGQASSRVLKQWRATAAGGEQLLATALLLAVERGGDPVRCVDAISLAVRSDQELASRRRVVVAQAKFSAGVLAILPLGFALFATTLTDQSIVQGRLSLAALGLGVSFDVLGVWWMYRMISRVR